MKDFVEYLERMIEGCDSLGGMEREKATYQSVLKEYRKQCNIPDVIHSITCGERDKDGFADTYVNGKKTNVRVLLWNKEEVEKLQKIGEEIHNENNSK